MSELFEKFLEQNNALEAFHKNLENTDYEYVNPDTFFRDFHYYEWAHCAFTWETSPEGLEYWYEIGERWRTIVQRAEQMTVSEFEEFLRENDAFDEFEKNLTATKESIYALNSPNWLVVAFFWCESPEGHHYWYDLQIKWHSLLITI